MPQLTQHDRNLLNDGNRDLGLDNHNMDAGAILLRRLAAEHNLENNVLYFQDQIRHGGQDHQFDAKRIGPHLLSYNKIIGSGIHWVLLAQAEGQSMIYDLALTNQESLREVVRCLFGYLEWSLDNRKFDVFRCATAKERLRLRTFRHRVCCRDYYWHEC